MDEPLGKHLGKSRIPMVTSFEPLKFNTVFNGDLETYFKGGTEELYKILSSVKLQRSL